ncbi:organic solute transporter alpha-like protein [Loa loa]|uniref:Organic solute transporter alpha-like protein n=1 Tax=Loa loa TaxID=7209 RepID=A0A1I7VLG8_LOALO|nr:organic solute transporter alpha-like protein [Loa loa]EFO26895.1 organic solute transporter alpha-like protein [Loa loa]
MKFSELTKTILELADWSSTDRNCTTLSDQPSAYFFIKNVNGAQFVLILFATAFTVIVLLLAAVHWFHVWMYVAEEKRQNKLYFLLSLFPVSTMCCYIGMISPRTSMVISSLGLLYFLTCLFVLISLIRHLFGSRDAFATVLLLDKRKIDFQSPPFCCCCSFLPKAKSTARNLRQLEWLVLQAPVVRAIIVTFNVIAIAEWREAANKYIHFSETISVASLLLAIFGVHTLARLTSDKLGQYEFMTIFRVVDIALLFFTAQQPMIFENILIRFNVLKCGPLLSAHGNARFVCNFVIIVEMLLLSLFISFMVAPSRSALFDLYGSKERNDMRSRLTQESLLSSHETDIIVLS